MQRDPCFLKNIFNRFPDRQITYQRFAEMKVDCREASLSDEARRTPRRIWLDLGIPPEKCETLSTHVHEMLIVAKQVMGQHYDAHALRQILKSWALPLVIASELPLEEMGWDDRLKWRDQAAFLAYGNGERADNFRRMNELYGPDGELYEDEGVLASDIDFIVTAMRAHYYKADFEHLAPQLNNIVTRCNAAILTSQGRALWNDMVHPRLAKTGNSFSLQP